MLSGSNSHGKYFHQNFNSYFEPRFHLNFVEICMFLKQTWWLCANTAWCSTDKTCENHWFFDEIMRKTWSKIWVGNLMKIFSMWIAPRRHSCPIKVCTVVSEMIFPRKTIKFSWFFMYADYCRVSYSKCMHCSRVISTQWDHFFGRGRAVEVLWCREFWIFSSTVSIFDPGMKYIPGI